jgi:hypothetical protein
MMLQELLMLHSYSSECHENIINFELGGIQLKTSQSIKKNSPGESEENHENLSLARTSSEHT